jgi:hypothetical protein
MERSRRDRAGVLPVHPLLIGAFPVLTLLGHNIVEIAAGDGLRILLLSIFLVGSVWLLARAVTGWNWGKSALVASLFASLFFSYGHAYSLVEGANLLGVRVGRHLFLGPLGLGIFIAGVWGVSKVRDTATLNRMLNIIGFALLAVPLYQISAHEITLLTSQARREQPAQDQPVSPGASQPDVYYIILDAYARDDVLLEEFGYDNTPFLQALEDRGFEIPRCTRSNYGRTYLSVSSSLNMVYIQDLAPRNGAGALTVAIKRSAVRQTLAAQGYAMVAFDAGFYSSQWPNADLYLFYENRAGGLRTINEFEALVVETTALKFFLDANTVLGGGPLGFVYETRRIEKFNRVNFILDNLENLPEVASPKFVWAHIPSPHAPYVFTKSGDFYPDPGDSPERYVDQVVYLNQRVLTIVDVILASSEVPPIIVIQGDHGASETKPDFRRLNILNAYYLPGEEHIPLYPTITPVNTFRLILDSYFGEELGLLPDVSYFSPIEDDYAFERAPDSRQGCEN